MNDVHQIGIGIYFKDEDQWIVSSIFTTAKKYPALTYLELGNVLVRLDFIKLTQSERPLYEGRIIKQ